jgi:hypothetical protein
VNSGKSVVAIARIDEILDTDPDKQDDGTLEPEIRGEIEFQDVWFSYPDQADQEPVLKGLSFHIHAGETVGILGPYRIREIHTGLSADSPLRTGSRDNSDRWNGYSPDQKKAFAQSGGTCAAGSFSLLPKHR